VKFRRYAALGVLHCWIVDPESNRLECYRVHSGEYRLVVRCRGRFEAGSSRLGRPRHRSHRALAPVPRSRRSRSPSWPNTRSWAPLGAGGTQLPTAS
jgi:hypothetical protein